MQITSKGQVTIPIDIRKRLNLLPNTEVRFEVDRDGARIIRVKTGQRGRGSALLSRMRGRATTTMTTEQILRLTRNV